MKCEVQFPLLFTASSIWCLLCKRRLPTPITKQTRSSVHYLRFPILRVLPIAFKQSICRWQVSIHPSDFRFVKLRFQNVVSHAQNNNSFHIGQVFTQVNKNAQLNHALQYKQSCSDDYFFCEICLKIFKHNYLARSLPLLSCST